MYISSYFLIHPPNGTLPNGTLPNRGGRGVFLLVILFQTLLCLLRPDPLHVQLPLLLTTANIRETVTSILYNVYTLTAV